MSYWSALLDAQRDARLPADERRAVDRDFAREVAQNLTPGDLLAPEEVHEFLRFSHSSQGQVLAKAVTLNPTMYEMAYPGGYAEERRGHKSVLYLGDFGIGGARGADPWVEKTHTGGFQFLKYMAEQLDVVQAIIGLRVHQASAFTRPYQENDNVPLGYRLARRDGERLGKDDLKEVRRLTTILENCGTEDDPVKRTWTYRRDTFQGFVKTLVRGWLTADAAPYELEPAAGGGLAGWYNIPWESVRLAYEEGYDGDDRIVAVQLSPSEKQAWIGYEADEIAYDIRNPRGDLRGWKYGMGELEHGVKAATAYLNAVTYNSAAVDRNSIPRGLLTLFGDFGKPQLNHFKQQWNAFVRGASRRFNMPVLVSKSRQEGGAVYTPIDTQTNEMLQTKWVIFQISVFCALYQMDPIEIAMESFTSKQSSLSGKDTSEKLQSSHDKGLVTLMGSVAQSINDRIVRRLTEKYLLTWVGLYPDDEERKATRQGQVLTVNEMRAIDGADEHPDPDIGNAPVNQVHMALYTMKKQQELLPDLTEDEGSDDRASSDDAGARRDAKNAGGSRPGLQPPASRPGKPSAGAAPGPAGRPPFAKSVTERPRLVVSIQRLPDEVWG